MVDDVAATHLNTLRLCQLPSGWPRQMSDKEPEPLSQGHAWLGPAGGVQTSTYRKPSFVAAHSTQQVANIFAHGRSGRPEWALDLAAEQESEHSFAIDSRAPSLQSTSSLDPSSKGHTPAISCASLGLSSGDDDPDSVRKTRALRIDYHPKSGRKCLNQYELLHQIGRGQHGRVKLARDTNTQRLVAIKILNRRERPRLGRPSATSSLEEKVHREISILGLCRHQSIVNLYEVIDEPGSRKIYLVLEYAERGELNWQSHDGKPLLSRQDARTAARNVLLAVEYLHAHNIVHRDIKPANLLMMHNGHVKLSDFGVSYHFDYATPSNDQQELAKTVGTPAFFAPELCFHDLNAPTPDVHALRHTARQADIWAYGVTVFCLMYGEIPFDADNEYELFRVIAQKPLELPVARTADMVLVNQFLTLILNKEPASRATIPDIMFHPWLAVDLGVDADLSRVSVPNTLSPPTSGSSSSLAGLEQPKQSQPPTDEPTVPQVESRDSFTSRLRTSFSKFALSLGRDRRKKNTVSPQPGRDLRSSITPPTLNCDNEWDSSSSEEGGELELVIGRRTPSSRQR